MRACIWNSYVVDFVVWVNLLLLFELLRPSFLDELELSKHYEKALL